MRRVADKDKQAHEEFWQALKKEMLDDPNSLVDSYRFEVKEYIKYTVAWRRPVGTEAEPNLPKLKLMYEGVKENKIGERDLRFIDMTWTFAFELEYY